MPGRTRSVFAGNGLEKSLTRDTPHSRRAIEHLLLVKKGNAVAQARCVWGESRQAVSHSKY